MKKNVLIAAIMRKLRKKRKMYLMGIFFVLPNHNRFKYGYLALLRCESYAQILNLKFVSKCLTLASWGLESDLFILASIQKRSALPSML